jgi:hypothetical protein
MSGDVQQDQRKPKVVVDATKIGDLYSNLESIIPKVEVAGSIPVSRCPFLRAPPIFPVFEIEPLTSL